MIRPPGEIEFPPSADGLKKAREMRSADDCSGGDGIMSVTVGILKSGSAQNVAIQEISTNGRERKTGKFDG